MSAAEFFSATSLPLLEPRQRDIRLVGIPGLKPAIAIVSLIIACLCLDRRLVLIVGVSTAFTSFHVWLAVQMCFYPVEKNIFWQGIVPRNAGKMAEMACDLMLNRLIKISEIISRLDGADFFRFLSLSGTLRAVHRNAQARIASRALPKLWAVTPEILKNELLDRSLEISEECVINIVSRCIVILGDRKYFDVKKLIVTSFVRQPGTLSHFFLKIGESEISFLKACGAALGVVSGFLQLFLYNETSVSFASKLVIFPMAGCILGLLTNWVALMIIFKPVEPWFLPLPFRKRPLRIQGLFLRRQQEVAEVYAKLISDAMLNPSRFIEYLKETGGWEAVLAIIETEIRDAIRREVSLADDSFLDLAVAELMLEFSSLEHAEKCLRYFEVRLGIRQLIQDRLELLPARDFESMLHPVFEEDEATLIALGGVLGLAVGFLQTLLL
jgi:uncharacterized membrane protein YheB (UPF0754 family)